MPTRRKIARRKSRKNTKTSFPLFFLLVCLIFFLAIASVTLFRNTSQFEKMPSWSEAFRLPSEGTKKHSPPKRLPEKDNLSASPYSHFMDSLFALRSFWMPKMDEINAGKLVDHDFFMLSYNEAFEQPYWVAYKLNGQNLAGPGRRNDVFKSDPNIVTGSAHSDDFLHSGYDRGHLAPAADFAYNQEATDRSFYMSNISPQDPGFNRGIWKKLETQVRSWAIENEELLIITGPLFEEKSKGLRIGENEVRIPEYFYKIIFDIYPPEYKMITFLLKNEKSSVPLLEYAISVDSLEHISGYDFFPMLPDSLEKRLEENEKFEIWFE